MSMVAVIWMAIASANGAYAGEQMTVETLLKEIEQAEARLTDVSAKFRQETKLPATGERQVITGTFEIIKKPERFKIRYTSPVEQIVSFDGAWLVMFYPETGQAFRQKTTLADMAHLIGIDPSDPTRNLRDNFDAELGECDDKSCKIRFSMKGAAGAEKAKSAAPSWKVRVSRNTYMVEEAEMRSDEIELRVRVFQYRANQGIEPASLRLDLPPGTEIFDGIPGLFGPMNLGGVRE